MVIKIFDWMHRKLHPVSNYSRVFQKKAPAFEDDSCDLTEEAHRPPPSPEYDPYTEIPLLLRVNLSGILTIGTLGHSRPLLPPHFPEDEPKHESPEKEIPAAARPPEKITLLQPSPDLFMIKTELSVEFGVSEEKIMAEPLLKEDRERKERTTLADLLSAEPAADGNQPPAVAVPTKLLPTSALKSGGKENKKSKKKKKGDDLEPLLSSAAAKRLHRMITRMVKKKIHPEAAVTGKKGGGADVVDVDLLLLSGRGGSGGHVA